MAIIKIPANLRITAILATSLLATPLAAAFAQAATDTQVLHDVVFVHEGEVDPCTGKEGTVTSYIKTVIFHESTDAKGGEHSTFTSTGTVVFEEEGEDGVTFTGRATIWGGFNDMSDDTSGVQVGTFTFSANLKGDDGSAHKFNMVFHVTMNPDGTLTSEVNKIVCH